MADDGMESIWLLKDARGWPVAYYGAGIGDWLVNVIFENFSFNGENLMNDEREKSFVNV